MDSQCENIRNQLADYILGTLKREQVDLINEHIGQCEPCRKYKESLENESRLLVEYGNEIESDMPARKDRAIETLNHSTTSQHKTSTIWSSIMNNKITKIAAAAVIIFAVLLTISVMDKSVAPAYALNQTMEAIRKIETVYMASRFLGFENTYDLSDEQLEQVKAKLIEMKPNIRKYWFTTGEMGTLMAGGEVVAGNSWESTLVELRAAGKDVVDLKPKEGRGGWSDSWMIVKGAEDNECIYPWLDYVSSPKAQALAVPATTASEVSSNPKAATAIATRNSASPCRQTALYQRKPMRARASA